MGRGEMQVEPPVAYQPAVNLGDLANACDDEGLAKFLVRWWVHVVESRPPREGNGERVECLLRSLGPGAEVASSVVPMLRIAR